MRKHSKHTDHTQTSVWRTKSASQYLLLMTNGTKKFQVTDLHVVEKLHGIKVHCLLRENDLNDLRDRWTGDRAHFVLPTSVGLPDEF